MVPNFAPQLNSHKSKTDCTFLWVFIKPQQTETVCVFFAHVGWEEEKKDKEEKEREKKRALLLPFFVNKSDLQNKRMATF